MRRHRTPLTIWAIPLGEIRRGPAGLAFPEAADGLVCSVELPAPPPPLWTGCSWGLRGKLRNWAPCGERRQWAEGLCCYRPGHGHLPVPGVRFGEAALWCVLWDQHLGSTRVTAPSRPRGTQHPGTPVKLMGLPQRHPPRDPSYSAGAAQARACAPAWHACPPFCFPLAYMPPRKPVSLFQVTLGVSGEEGTACARPAPSGKARGLWA